MQAHIRTDHVLSLIFDLLLDFVVVVFTALKYIYVTAKDANVLEHDNSLSILKRYQRFSCCRP